MPGPRRSLLILVVLFVLMNLVGLDRSSLVWVDEVTLNDPAKELALHGTLRSSVFAGADGFDQTYLWLPPAQPLLIAAVYKMFGFGIWQTRIPSVLFGASAVAMLYFIARRLLNAHRPALLSVVLFALNPQFVHTVRSGRMDAQCLFLAFVGILLFLRSQSQRNSIPLLRLAGVAIGLSGLTHPIAIVWGLAIIVLIILTQPSRKLFTLMIFCTSAALLPVVWIVYALRTPEYFKAQFLSIVTAHTAQGTILSRIIDEFARYGIVYQAVPLLLLALVAGISWFVFKYKDVAQSKLRLCILFLIPFLFVAFFMTKTGGSWFYILHPVSMLTIMAGAMAGSLLPSQVTGAASIRHRATMAAASLLFLNLLIGGIVGRYIVLMRQWNARNYESITEPIRALIPRGSVIFGAPEVWYAAENAGAALRLRGQPDPKLHDFVVTKSKDSITAIQGFRKIADIGHQLPPVLGSYTFSSTDYQLVIWEADRRATDIIDLAENR